MEEDEAELREPWDEDDSDTVGEAGKRWVVAAAAAEDMRWGGTECERVMSLRLAEAERRRGVSADVDTSRPVLVALVSCCCGGNVGEEVIGWGQGECRRF